MLWSKEAAASDWVRAEAQTWRAARASWSRCHWIKTSPPMPFNQIQCGDLADWAGNTDDRRLDQADGQRSLLAPPSWPPAWASPPTCGRPRSWLCCPSTTSPATLNCSTSPTGSPRRSCKRWPKTTRPEGRSGALSSFQFRGPRKGGAAGGRRTRLQPCAWMDRSGAAARGCASPRPLPGRVRAARPRSGPGRFDRDLSDVFALQDEIAEAARRRRSSRPSAPLRQHRTDRSRGL